MFERRGSVVACHLPSGRKLRLAAEAKAASERDEHGIATVRVAGRFVAAVAKRAALSPGDVSSDRLTLVDAERGRAVDIGSPGCEPLLAGYGAVAVAGVAVTADGALAWGCSGDAVEIHKFDAAGPAILDSRPNDYRGLHSLEFDSVAISEATPADYGGWVYWHTSQGARSAELQRRIGGEGEPAGGRGWPPRCDPGRSTTVGGSRQVRVYVRGRSVFACHFATGRTRRLGREPRQARLRDVRIVDIVRVAGRYVAFTERRPPRSATGHHAPDRLHLLDVRRGRRVDFGGVGCRRFPLVLGLDLTADGAMAWGCEVGPAPSSRTQIRKFDRGGPALLATNAGAASSVAISEAGFDRAAGRVYWRTRDGASSAALR